ncbi:MAG TPA: PHP domain-containing protein [Verrucomicrobiae bacterium]|nr:PHP domain-containing protein [Verrucomicrobiae bacterium]
MKFADLHLHTRYSDGSYTPEELVREAARQGFAAIAVTDHDTLDAVPESRRAGGEFAIEVIAGVEITCRVETQEVHMLGFLFGETWKDQSLRAVLDHSKRVREQRIAQFVVKFNELGIPLTLQDVQELSNAGTVGRPHVAMALQKRGFVKSVEEAFERFLKRGKPAFVERYRMTAGEAIGHIKRAGGVAVLAHPALNRVDAQIPNLVEQGLDGLEVWHSRQSPAQSESYLKLAERLGLLATGGSDCHGTVRGEPLLGSVKIPYDRVEALRERVGQTK